MKWEMLMLTWNQINLPAPSGFSITINSNSFLPFFEAKEFVLLLTPGLHSICWEIPLKHLESDYFHTLLDYHLILATIISWKVIALFPGWSSFLLSPCPSSIILSANHTAHWPHALPWLPSYSKTSKPSVTSRALHQPSDISSPLTLLSSHLSLLLLLRHSKPAPASGPLHLPTSLPSSALLPCLTPWLICWFQVLTSVLYFKGGLYCSLSLNCTPRPCTHTHIPHIS